MYSATFILKLNNINFKFNNNDSIIIEVMIEFSLVFIDMVSCVFY